MEGKPALNGDGMLSLANTKREFPLNSQLCKPWYRNWRFCDATFIRRIKGHQNHFQRLESTTTAPSPNAAESWRCKGEGTEDNSVHQQAEFNHAVTSDSLLQSTSHCGEGNFSCQPTQNDALSCDTPTSAFHRSFQITTGRCNPKHLISVGINHCWNIRVLKTVLFPAQMLLLCPLPVSHMRDTYTFFIHIIMHGCNAKKGKKL